MNKQFFIVSGRYLLRNIFDVHVVQHNSLPRRNYIVASNHLNWLDPILVTLAWPVNVDFMYIGPRQAVINTAWKRWFVKRYPGVVLTFQRRGWPGKIAYESVFQGLKRGKSLLIFPEGDAFPSEGEIKSFSNGVAHFALKTGTPIIPVGLCGTAELYYRKRLLMQIGTPIDVPQLSHLSKDQVVDIRECLQEKIFCLIRDYHDPDVLHKPMHWLTNLL